MKELRIKDICVKGSSSIKQKDVEGKKGKYPVYGASGIVGYRDTFDQGKDYIGIVKDGSGIGRVMFLPAKSSVIGTLQYILPKPGYNINYIGFCLQSLGLSSYKQGAAIPHIYFRDYGERVVLVDESPEAQEKIVQEIIEEYKNIDRVKETSQNALDETSSLFQTMLRDLLAPKSHWSKSTLKEVTSKIGSGATPKGGRRVYVESGCSFIRSMNVLRGSFKYDSLAHIDENAAKQLSGVEIHPKDVLFNITGASIARCAVVPTDVIPARVNQHVCIIRIERDLLPEFLCFALNSPQHQKELLEIGEAGSTRQAITKSDLEKHTIHYPNKDEQEVIVSKLASLQKRIKDLQDNYNHMISECDLLKQAILKEVFGN